MWWSWLAEEVKVEVFEAEVLEESAFVAVGDYVVQALVHVRLSLADVEEEVEEVCVGEAVLQVEEEVWEREEAEAKVEVEVVEVEVDEV